MDAIVLAGGRAVRLGGLDKAELVVGARTLLQRALDVTESAHTTVVVGPSRATSRPVEWVLEDPPGGGPVAAIEAGLGCVTGELVAVVAVDLPLLEPGDLAELRAAGGGKDGAIFVDEAGRDQPLAGVYRSDRLRAALRALPEVDGAGMRDLVARLDLVRVVNERASRDCDTEEDVRRAREAFGGR